MLKLNVLYNAVYLSRSIRPNKYPKIEFEIESKVRYSLLYIPLPFERQIQTSLRTWLCVHNIYNVPLVPSLPPCRRAVVASLANRHKTEAILRKNSILRQNLKQKIKPYYRYTEKRSAILLPPLVPEFLPKSLPLGKGITWCMAL